MKLCLSGTLQDGIAFTSNCGTHFRDVASRTPLHTLGGLPMRLHFASALSGASGWKNGTFSALAAAGLAFMCDVRRRRQCWMARNRARIVAAATSEEVEELRSLRTRDLRRKLSEAGLNVTGCFDRESLLELLEADGAVERVLDGPQAEVDEQNVAEVPLLDSDGYIALDLTVGGSSTPARFMIDTGAPVTVIDHRMITTLGAQRALSDNVLPSGLKLPPGAHVYSLGNARLGSLALGEVHVLPVEMPLPAGCCGLLSLDFLKGFDWELDRVQGKARVAAAPADPSSPPPFDVEGLRRVPLQQVRATASGLDMQLLAAPAQLTHAGVVLRSADGAGTISCSAVLDFGSITAISTGLGQALGLKVEDLRNAARQVMGPSGTAEFVQETTLTLALDDGKPDPPNVTADIYVGHPAFQKLGFSSETPIAILGLDVLGRSRFVFSPHSSALWVDTITRL